MDEQITDIIKQQKNKETGDILKLLKKQFGEDEILEAIKKLENKGVIELTPMIHNKINFFHYLTIALYNIWLYTTFLVVIGNWGIIYLIPQKYLFYLIRWILGAIFILILPGYVTVEALFPNRGSLTLIERLALSVGLSVVLSPMIGLGLNYTPWGIKLNSIMVVQSFFIMCIAILAAWRKFRTSVIEFENYK